MHDLKDIPPDHLTVTGLTWDIGRQMKIPIFKHRVSCWPLFWLFWLDSAIWAGTRHNFLHMLAHLHHYTILDGPAEVPMHDFCRLMKNLCKPGCQCIECTTWKDAIYSQEFLSHLRFQWTSPPPSGKLRNRNSRSRHPGVFSHAAAILYGVRNCIRPFVAVQCSASTHHSVTVFLYM